MSDYSQVKKAMAAGTPLELICAACPWDRLCLTPPSTTQADIDRAMKEAQKADDAQAGGKGYTATLMAAMVFAGRDTAAQMCPVFAARLGSQDGRAIADSLRAQMQGFEATS
jgi:hypothetical protein